MTYEEYLKKPRINKAKANLAYKKRLKRRKIIERLVKQLDDKELEKLYDFIGKKYVKTLIIPANKADKENNGH
jgi:hypothetical protein